MIEVDPTLVQLVEAGGQELDTFRRLGEEVEFGAGIEAGRKLICLKLMIILPADKETL
jgi:hypothetical protein